MDRHDELSIAPTISTFPRSIACGVLIGGLVSAFMFPAQLKRVLGIDPRQPQMVVATQAGAAAATLPRWAEFGDVEPSPDARHLADWVADSGNNQHRDFLILDKKFTRLYVFDHNARLRASTPVLLGAAPGDESVPGIGSRAIEDIAEHERTTPAGRFEGRKGINANQEEVVWVDYAAAVSMHRVRATVASERRLERLASPTIDDNRISWGCINVPVAFFDDIVAPLFARQHAIVYVLPETKPVQAVFGSYSVAARHGLMPSGHSGRTAGAG
jgi:hypothetical protein